MRNCGAITESMRARTPEFFSNVRSITVRDPLAEFLGAVSDGRIEYAYLDVVKLTGHSCPTVAGAYSATIEALSRLYPSELPERGAVSVELRDRAEDGVAGVVASVAGLITGAAAEGGFKGVGGRFQRRGLLTFGAPISADLRFTRLDNGAAVEIDLRGASPLSPDLRAALQRALSPDSSTPERQAFGKAWQARTAAMLFP